MKPSVILYKDLPDNLLARLENHFTVTGVKDLSPGSLSQHALAFASAEGIIGASEKVGRTLLTQMPKLRAASTISVGYDNYDVAALNERGVLLMHTPTVLTETVADTIMTLMLTSARTSAFQCRSSITPVVSIMRRKRGLTRAIASLIRC